MAYLILVRHGITNWNKEGKWHGQSNVPINEEGKIQAKKDAEVLKEFPISKVYVSELLRTQQTFEEINNILHLSIPIEKVSALNERSYGIYTGKNKWQVKEEIGEERFNLLRRSWDYPIPEGESLKQVYERVIPFYQNTVLPDLKKGMNILLVSSGNTLRALTKYLENLPHNKISSLELNFGEVDIYTIDSEGKITNKETKLTNLVEVKK